MMLYLISPPNLIKSAIQLPSSKSISNRVLIIHALAQGINEIERLSDCDDTKVMIKALTEKGETIDIKAAGTAMRFLTAYLSIMPGEHIITGTERMQQRPIGILIDALRQLGANITYMNKEGFPPLRIRGQQHLKENNNILLTGNISSQYISALLMIGPILNNGLHLQLEGEIVSRPYIDLTIRLMNEFGADVSWTSPQNITVKPQPYQDIPFTVESDWTAASYWYQLVALSSSPKTIMELPGLLQNSYQGDRRCADIFNSLGVSTEFLQEGVNIKKNNTPVPEYLEEDFTDVPDLAQTLVVTCCLLNVHFHFTGLESLKIKETDRITALKTELAKLGFILHEENNNVLYWNGERCTPNSNPEIQTYEDHRMAMAFAPASLIFGNIKIASPQVVSKSYPNYWGDLMGVGFTISESQNYTENSNVIH